MLYAKRKIKHPMKSSSACKWNAKGAGSLNYSNDLLWSSCSHRQSSTIHWRASTAVCLIKFLNVRQSPQGKRCYLAQGWTEKSFNSNMQKETIMKCYIWNTTSIEYRKVFIFVGGRNGTGSRRNTELSGNSKVFLEA